MPNEVLNDDRLVLLSFIPVWAVDGKWHTIDIWARDINEQAKLLTITLICPVAEPRPGNSSILDPAIQVVDSTEKFRDADLRTLVSSARYVQVPGNFGWRQSSLAIRILRIARANRVLSLLGISSNRARTALFNSRGKGLVATLKAYLRFADIRLTQRYLARRVDGVFLVGSGLLPLIKGCNSEVHIGTASWIAEDDIRPPAQGDGPALRLCMAGRLERMKGFHIGLDAIAAIRKRIDIRANIIGAGPELSALQAGARARGVEDIVQFTGILPYPEPFLSYLGEHDAVLLTNLNDEQPRLIFDAISRGCLPVCPDNPAYLDLGLDHRLIYRQGDASDLSRRMRALADSGLRSELRAATASLAEKFTIGAMHRRRLEWMKGLERRD